MEIVLLEGKCDTALGVTAQYVRSFTNLFITSAYIPLYNDRPVVHFIRDQYDEVYIYLNEEIHFWFLDMNVPYSFRSEGIDDDADCIAENGYITWYLDLPDETAAVLFKLTWGGL
jgi:hypothetical protein